MGKLPLQKGIACRVHVSFPAENQQGKSGDLSHFSPGWTIWPFGFPELATLFKQGSKKVQLVVPSPLDSFDSLWGHILRNMKQNLSIFSVNQPEAVVFLNKHGGVSQNWP